jgi:hypothetical protein
MERAMWDDEECREHQVGARAVASIWALVAVILLATAAWGVLGTFVYSAVLTGSTAGAM